MRLVRSSFYNILGLGLPLVAAVFCIPVLIRELGETRFGLLTLIWALVSYFGLFDLGLGRALTQHLAVILAKNDREQIGPLMLTSTILMATLGIIAGVVMALLANWGVGLIRLIPDRNEAVYSVYLMAIALPAIVLTSGFRGVLEAYHAFDIINYIRLPMGLFTFLGPVFVVLYLEPKLEVVSGVLVIGRLVGCAIHAWCAWRIVRNDCKTISIQSRLIKPLCISGGWLTLGNIISPFMGYVDRFVIAGIISATAVAYYTTPHEIVTKLWIVPGALTTVLFPTFAALAVLQDEQTRSLFNRAVYWLFLIVLPITALLAIFSWDILSIWVGNEFAEQGSLLMQMFALGILVNSLAHVPYTLIQSIGNARLTSITHAVQLPFYLMIMWWLTSSYGLMGAALAWLFRMLVDTCLMFFLCNYSQGWPQTNTFNIKCLGCALVVGIAFVGILFDGWVPRVAWGMFVIVCSSVILVKNIHLARRENTKSSN